MEKEIDINNLSNASIEEYSQIPAEKEVLVFPFSCFEITESKDINDKKYGVYKEIHLKYLGKYGNSIKAQLGDQFLNQITNSEFAKELNDFGLIKYEFTLQWIIKEQKKINFNNIYFLLENNEDFLGVSQNLIIIFSMKTKEIKQKISIHKEKVLNIIKLNDNKICSSSIDKTINIIKLKNENKEHEIIINKNNNNDITFKLNQNNINIDDKENNKKNILRGKPNKLKEKITSIKNNIPKYENENSNLINNYNYNENNILNRYNDNSNYPEEEMENPNKNEYIGEDKNQENNNYERITINNENNTNDVNKSEDIRLNFVMQKLGLESLIHIFENYHMSFNDVLFLTRDDLNELGLKIFQKNRLISFIEEYTSKAKNYTLEEIQAFFEENSIYNLSGNQE